jgi:hypothetical protein
MAEFMFPFTNLRDIGVSFTNLRDIGVSFENEGFLQINRARRPKSLLSIGERRLANAAKLCSKTPC